MTLFMTFRKTVTFVKISSLKASILKYDPYNFPTGKNNQNISPKSLEYNFQSIFRFPKVSQISAEEIIFAKRSLSSRKHFFIRTKILRDIYCFRKDHDQAYYLVDISKRYSCQRLTNKCPGHAISGDVQK